MEISYDKLANAMYIKLAVGKVARTQVINEDVLLNIGEDGTVLGVELLGVSDWVQEPGKITYEDKTTPYPDVDKVGSKAEKRDA